MLGSEIQLEKGGWSKLHNRIYEVLSHLNISSREFRCLLFLLRKTYGHGKKYDAISLQQWEEGTGIRRIHIKTTLERLEKRKIIIREVGRRGRGNASIYSFNKYYEQWIVDGFDPKKVPTGVSDNDEKGTPVGTNEKVPPWVPNEKKKVPTGVHEKGTHGGTHNRQKAASGLHASDFPENVAVLIRQCYEAIGKTATNGNLNGANAQTANDLIDTYGWRTCIDAVSKIGQRHQAGKDIRAPVSYLKTVLSDYEPVPAAQTDFSMEDIADV